MTSNDIFVDPPEVKPSVIDYTSFARQSLNNKKQLFKHSSFVGGKWPTKTDRLCLHCCMAFDTMPIPIPRFHDTSKNVYHVFGIFCSINCAKAYIIEHDVSISTTRMMYFISMCREVFNIRHPVKPAPPRTRLQMFGGDLTPEQFKRNAETVSCILRPPFIPSYDLVVKHDTKVDNEPQELSICKKDPKNETTYSKFVKPSRKRKPMKQKSYGDGCLSEFVRLK